MILITVLGFVINKAILGKAYIDPEGVNVPLIIMLILLIAAPMYFFAVMKDRKANFRDSMKNKLMKPIVSFIDPSFVYEANNYVNSNYFKESHLFSEKPDSYTGDDKISGKIDKTDFMFSELKVGEVHEITGEDGNTITKTTEYFKGLFFIADFNKNFKGKYFILPDSLEKRFGRFANVIQKANSFYGDLIKLEDIEFEKEFVVYGSDQIEARYILSSSMMKRLLELKEKNNKKIRISFVNSKIFIAIPFKEDLFEPRYHLKVTNEKILIKFFECLVFVTNIIEDLNLNTRIWTKN